MKRALKPEHCAKPFRCRGGDTVPRDIPSTCSEMLPTRFSWLLRKLSQDTGKAQGGHIKPHLFQIRPISVVFETVSTSGVVIISYDGHESTRDPGSCCPGELLGYASDCSSIGPPAEENTKAGQNCHKLSFYAPTGKYSWIEMG